MITPRRRMAAIAGSLTLTATMLAAPVALAQDDDPAATFDEFAVALESLDLVALPTFFCADQTDALGGLGLNDLTAGMPPEFDFMLDSVRIDIDVEKADVVSQSETEAIVDVVATMSIEFDLESIMPLLLEMAAGFGVSDDEIALMQAEILADAPAPETETLEGQITLVPGDTRPWLICSDLDFGDIGMGGDDMSDDDMDDDMDDDDMDEDEDGE